MQVRRPMTVVASLGAVPQSRRIFPNAARHLVTPRGTRTQTFLFSTRTLRSACGCCKRKEHLERIPTNKPDFSPRPTPTTLESLETWTWRSEMALASRLPFRFAFLTSWNPTTVACFFGLTLLQTFSISWLVFPLFSKMGMGLQDPWAEGIAPLSFRGFI